VTDVVSPAIRSRMMAGIKSRNTKPEFVVRKALFAAGYRFRLHRNDLPGRPDIVLPRRRIAVFVHGCFWHMHEGCRYAKLPSTHQEFWREKLGRNVLRDGVRIKALLGLNWRVLIVWECLTRVRDANEILPGLIADWIESDESFGEFPSSVSVL